MEKKLTDIIINILLTDQSTGGYLCKVEVVNDKTNNKRTTVYKQGQVLAPVYYRTNDIETRTQKISSEQKQRTNNSGEVFTPSKLVNSLLHLFIKRLFGGKTPLFTINQDLSYEPKLGKISFRSGQWLKFVECPVLEPTCGEVPFIANRYDAQSGTYIPIPMRCGILDHKLRVVSENTSTIESWVSAAILAVESVYACDLQGDNVFIARRNIFQDVVEHFFHKFGNEASFPDSQVLHLATVISYNVFQCDILTDTVPYAPEVFCKAILWSQKLETYFYKLKNSLPHGK